MFFINCGAAAIITCALPFLLRGQSDPARGGCCHLRVTLTCASKIQASFQGEIINELKAQFEEDYLYSACYYKSASNKHTARTHIITISVIT